MREHYIFDFFFDFCVQGSAEVCNSSFASDARSPIGILMEMTFCVLLILVTGRGNCQLGGHTSLEIRGARAPQVFNLIYQEACVMKAVLKEGRSNHAWENC